MSADRIHEVAQNLRQQLAALFQQAIASSTSNLKIKMDPEIEQEIRERVAVLMFDEMVNDMPMVPYLAVWEAGAKEIFHAYMSPRIEEICGYSPLELLREGYINIVRGDIISFYREPSGVEEKVDPLAEAQKTRIAGFLENRSWEGCYQLASKDGRQVWVIDRSTNTRFRNSVNDNIICLACGILLETTELLDRRK